jgi:hypothetical protein
MLSFLKFFALAASASAILFPGSAAAQYSLVWFEMESHTTSLSRRLEPLDQLASDGIHYTAKSMLALDSSTVGFLFSNAFPDRTLVRDFQGQNTLQKYLSLSAFGNGRAVFVDTLREPDYPPPFIRTSTHISGGDPVISDYGVYGAYALGLAFGNGRFLAMGYEEDLRTGIAQRSTNGLDWDALILRVPPPPGGVVSGPVTNLTSTEGQFYAVFDFRVSSDGGVEAQRYHYVMTSLDGGIWSFSGPGLRAFDIPPAPSAAGESITVQGGIGRVNRLMVSPDGMNLVVAVTYVQAGTYFSQTSGPGRFAWDLRPRQAFYVSNDAGQTWSSPRSAEQFLGTLVPASRTAYIYDEEMGAVRDGYFYLLYSTFLGDNSGISTDADQIARSRDGITWEWVGNLPEATLTPASSLARYDNRLFVTPAGLYASSHGMQTTRRQGSDGGIGNYDYLQRLTIFKASFVLPNPPQPEPAPAPTPVEPTANQLRIAALEKRILTVRQRTVNPQVRAATIRRIRLEIARLRRTP